MWRVVTAVVAVAGVAWEELGQLLMGGLGAWGLGLETGLLLPQGLQSLLPAVG